MFKCECGKEFENWQSFNGHKSHCKIHYIAKYGNDEVYNNVRNAGIKRIIDGGLAYNKQRIEVKHSKLQKWLEAEHQCETCGKVMTEKFGTGRFCSRSCANSRQHSEETKTKIALSLAKRKQELESNSPSCKLLFSKAKRCTNCGKVLAHENKTGFCRDCLHSTKAGMASMRAAGKQGYETMLKNGTYHPWQSRNIKSYAEQFWERVLRNNNIAFIREFVVPHCNSSYFLDFLIEVNGKKLDLEIDGKQHKYEDRVKSDLERDEYLINEGYIIYRIPWNSINKEQGKKKMQQKIEDFLAFYRTI